jgi:hypothetical protein
MVITEKAARVGNALKQNAWPFSRGVNKRNAAFSLVLAFSIWTVVRNHNVQQWAPMPMDIGTTAASTKETGNTIPPVNGNENKTIVGVKPHILVHPTKETAKTIPVNANENKTTVKAHILVNANKKKTICSLHASGNFT